MDPADYLSRAGLSLPDAAVRDGQRRLWSVLDEVRKASIPASPHALNKLYTYPVPKLSPDGSCSLVNELEPKPYDLTAVLGGRGMKSTLSLMVLSRFVEAAATGSHLDWLGVYQLRPVGSGRALVKLAAKGLPSRAEFPVTDEFAKKSNNVAVALSGQARVIADVAEHVKNGGPYYECSPTIRSEACVPIFDRAGVVVGIVDAEHSTPNAFGPETLGWVVAVACEAAQHLP